MSVVVNDKIWQLTEKLYIHCFSVNEFLSFLHTQDVNLPANFYDGFEVYSFMSTDQNDFAHFMQRVPSYKYILILESIIFDERLKSTQNDNWNYYGKYIKDWYPDLIKEIGQMGLKIEYESKKIIFEDPDLGDNQNSPDFLKYSFRDPFLDYIMKEINENSHDERYLSVAVLSRKLIECLIIKIFEVVFNSREPNGTYNAQNHLLWYDPSNSRVLDFNILLVNLNANSSAFHEDKDLVEDICTLIHPVKNQMNKFIHRDYKFPQKNDIERWDFPDLIYKLRKIYIKYCNP